MASIEYEFSVSTDPKDKAEWAGFLTLLGKYKLTLMTKKSDGYDLTKVKLSGDVKAMQKFAKDVMWDNDSEYWEMWPGLFEVPYQEIFDRVYSMAGNNFDVKKKDKGMLLIGDDYDLIVTIVQKK